MFSNLAFIGSIFSMFEVRGAQLLLIFSFGTFSAFSVTKSSLKTIGEGRRFSKLLEDDNEFIFLQRLLRSSSCGLSVCCVYSPQICMFLRSRMVLTRMEPLVGRKERAVVPIQHCRPCWILSRSLHE